jgi:predicted AAA+ superfamily ATPase
MIRRPFWLKRIQKVWEKVPIVWLSGVRRVGKTSLVQELEHVHYVNCDLEKSVMRLKNPELFFESVSEPIIVFDEIHRLRDPSNVLKIGADVYKQFKILATGSSTLAATSKFSDTLTGRKRSIYLPPVLPIELEDFGIKDLKVRLLRGGLPPALLVKKLDYEFYAEWMDSFFARDIQELFRVEKRDGFMRLLKVLLKNNGGLAPVNNLANYAGLSVQTVNTYLRILETTHVIYCLRPFHGGGTRETIKQPKYYAFDTGFVAYYNGWSELRNDDCGKLLENLVLETLLSRPQVFQINFWRDKEKSEIDFVCSKPGGDIDTIECKWDADAFDAKALNKFRAIYPKGNNYVICAQTKGSYKRSFKDTTVTFMSIYDFHTQYCDDLNM